MRGLFAYRDVLSDGQAERLCGRIPTSVEGLTGCALDSQARAIVLDAPDAATLARAHDVIAGLAARERTVPAAPPRRLRERAPDPCPGAPQGEARRSAPRRPLAGVLHGFAALLPQRLDRFFLELALGLEAEPRQYPAMIPLAAMERCRYIEHFPQDIYTVYEYPHDAAALAQIVATRDYRASARPTPFLLATAVCYHCYHELAGLRLPGSLLLTAEGRCFRHEAPWRLNPRRLAEFRMREIVFLGPAAFVRQTREHLMTATWDAFTAFGLGGHIETACDPFYFPADAALGQEQLLHDMKYELVAAPTGLEPFSLSSFNDVGTSLCAAFDVRDGDDAVLHSGCVGFGLDRWTQALVATHGDDPGAWPEGLLRLLDLTPQAVPSRQGGPRE